MNAPLPSLYPLRDGLPPAQLRTPIWQLELAVSILRQYFSGTERLAAEMSSFLWDPDETKSRLFVATRDNFVVKDVGHRPAIIVSLAEQTYPKQVLGDQVEVDGQLGRVTYQDWTKGGWEFSCLAAKAQEALSLATEIKYFLQAYRHPIARQYGFHAIRVEGMGRYEKQPEYGDEYGCPVRASFELEDQFVLEQEALKVTAVRIGLVPR